MKQNHDQPQVLEDGAAVPGHVSRRRSASRPPGGEQPGIAIRRRNAVLASLEAIRAIDPRITTGNVIAFLYVCENEGICVTDLATLCGLSVPTTSRSVRRLGRRGVRGALPPYLGLVEISDSVSDASSRSLRLSPAGEALAVQIDRLIDAQVRIRD